MTSRQEARYACDNQLVVSIRDNAFCFAIPDVAVRVYACGRLACVVGPRGIVLQNDGRGEYWPKPCRNVAYDTISHISVAGWRNKIFAKARWKLSQSKYLKVIRAKRKGI